MRRATRLPRKVKPSFVAACLVLVLIGWHLMSLSTYGAHLGERSLQLGSNQISATPVYKLQLQLTTTGTLGSISIQFCSDDPFPGNPCTPPAGMDASSAVLTDQAGPTGFSISGASTANRIILTRPPVLSPAGAARYNFDGITNPSASGSYYVRLQTYASDDATGPSSDDGGIAFAITNGLSINTTVPPYLVFCTGVTIGGMNCANATGDYIDFGELSSKSARSGSSQMLVGTNAEEGYNITLNGTTLTSGNNVISAISPGDVSRPGTPQFGLNLRANNAPPTGVDVSGPGASTYQPAYGVPNFYRFVPGDVVVDNPVSDDMRKYTSSYIANVPSTQAPGVYVSTVTYICLANF